MAWNQPNGKTRVNAKKSKGMAWAVVAVVVLAVAGGAWWLLSSDTTESPAPSEPSPVEPVEKPLPAPYPKVKEPPVKAARVVVTNAAGIPLLPDGRPARLYPEPPPSKYGVTTTSVSAISKEIEVQTFKKPTDIQLAFIVNAMPGDEFGDGLDTRDFTYHFLESLKTPIEIDPKDDERTVELKQAVIEARKELKARYDAGEDIEHVVNDSIAELQELGRYKNELQKQVDAICRDPNTTEKDAEDCYEAANKMLEEKGVSLLKMPKLVRRRAQSNEWKLKKRQKPEEETK